MGKKKRKTIEYTVPVNKKQKAVQGPGNNGDDDPHRTAMTRIMHKLQRVKDPTKTAILESKLGLLMQHISQDAAAGVAAGAKQRAAAAAQQQQQHGNFQFRQQRTSGSISALGAPLTLGEKAKRQQRQQRFIALEADDCSGREAPLVRQSGMGTSAALEKEYLRLTSLPRASDVRPPQVLTVALALMKSKWQQDADYVYTCEQLKSIRQDLTVQHIRDSLTVDAYETHGRIALEMGDMAEFRQCHSVLKQLYKEGVPGNREEFLAYGLLFMQSTGKGSMMVSELPVADLAHPSVAHALRVCSAFRQGDYHAFTTLYSTAPRMSPYLMDRLLPRMRAWALQAMMVAYRPTPVPLTHIAAELAVDQDAANVVTLVEEAGGCVDSLEDMLDTKRSCPKAKAVQ